MANLKSLDTLIGWVAKRKGGREVVRQAMEALQELFVTVLLPDRRLKHFEQQPLGVSCELGWGLGCLFAACLVCLFALCCLRAALRAPLLVVLLVCSVYCCCVCACLAAGAAVSCCVGMVVMRQAAVGVLCSHVLRPGPFRVVVCTGAMT